MEDPILLNRRTDLVQQQWHSVRVFRMLFGGVYMGEAVHQNVRGGFKKGAVKVG